ncbi:MAG: ATP-dependent helicase [Candidatus Omnitrophota bacterium]|nr:ATP-dependent helicase [Candidatus Omnitrophota bacterium]
MASKIDYKTMLNSTQLEAVQLAEGPCLVIAGAGSGKTRILVYRVAYLVEKGIDPGKILLLTFTRKAAQEMLSRASFILDARCRAVSGGTFHSFANMILRRHAPRLGLPRNFSILDQADAENTVNLVRANSGFDSFDKRFPKKKALLNIISKSVNKSEDIELVVDAEYPHFLIYSGEIKKIKRKYVEYKYKKGFLDFDDLLVHLKELLSAHEDIRVGLSERYRYIMVDEYQDTNKLQADILYLLLAKHNNIMVVGDDSQSIYSFRGANFRNIIDFPKFFKDTKIITLEENYRSAQPILDLTNRVISAAAEKFDKNLFSKKKGGNAPVYIDAENENGQSGYIMEKLTELTSKGVELGDIAVLFRAGWHSNDLEIELAKNNIPFVKYGGQKFVESAHIKDIVSHMRVAYNRSDEISWRRVLLLMRGVGAKTADSLIKGLISGKRNLPSGNKLMKKSQDIERLKNVLREIDDKCRAPLEIFKAFSMYYQPIFRERYDDFHKRLSDMESLERIAARYKDMEAFLTDMALEPPEKNIADANIREKDKKSLILSTVHSAKGLEWHTVFVIYVAEGHMPSYQSFGDENSIEEERRLLYVAMTRAKENLYMLRPLTERSGRSYAVNNGSMFTRISRFLDGVI